MAEAVERGGGDPRRRHDRALGAVVQHRRAQGVVERAGAHHRRGADGHRGGDRARATAGIEVTVLERGEVGASLRTLGADAILHAAAHECLPRRRAPRRGSPRSTTRCSTGAEYAPTACSCRSSTRLAGGDVRARTRVVAIGRRGLTRGDYAGHPLRAERPFRMLCEQDDEVFEADVVLDASGGLAVPRAIGVGGLPARGEARLAGRPIRTLGELTARAGDAARQARAAPRRRPLRRERDRLCSALAAREPRRASIWAVRAANRRPCEEVPNDPLPERSVVVDGRTRSPSAAGVSARRAEGDDRERAQNNGHDRDADRRTQPSTADAIAAFTGYRPDGASSSELTVETSPVTEGGARLYRAISNITDCLCVPRGRRAADSRRASRGTSSSARALRPRADVPAADRTSRRSRRFSIHFPSASGARTRPAMPQRISSVTT